MQDGSEHSKSRAGLLASCDTTGQSWATFLLCHSSASCLFSKSLHGSGWILELQSLTPVIPFWEEQQRGKAEARRVAPAPVWPLFNLHRNRRKHCCLHHMSQNIISGPHWGTWHTLPLNNIRLVFLKGSREWKKKAWRQTTASAPRGLIQAFKRKTLKFHF